MISNYYLDCPNCSKAEKPRKNTVAEFFIPEIDFETQTTVYACNRCGWAYKRVYSYITKRTTTYEISFDKNNNIILTPVEEVI
jgi:uncharacterized Zn finger protein